MAEQSDEESGRSRDKERPGNKDGMDGAKVERRGVMHIRSLPEAIKWQAEHVYRAGADATARIVLALAAAAKTPTHTAQRMREWPGLALEDAMPLRLTGGLHNLLLTGRDARLQPVYARQERDQAVIERLVSEMFIEHDAFLRPWLDHPPQTNEAGRSASIIAALKWLSPRIGSRFALYELGASAGINVMMGRYHYDLGGMSFGPPDSPMQIAPEWRGAPPPDSEVEIMSAAGCDQSPIDLTDEADALRLKSYIWPEIAERIARLDAAIALARRAPPDLVKADAADWAENRLATPQEPGTVRVLYHTIVWQYLGPERRDRIERAMAAAASEASPERPLAWAKLETNRETFRHELWVRYWAGGKDAGECIWHRLGEAHPHGAWVHWEA